MIVYLESLGCCRNQVDSELMLGRLKERGHTLASEPSEAEVVIVNTCGFISAASEEAVDTILAMARLKKTGTLRRLVVTGCLPERYRDQDIAESLPEVDAFLGTGAYDSIVDAVEGKPAAPLILFPQPVTRNSLIPEAPRRLTQDYMAYVKVAEGCNRHCTYCIIPRLRGTQRSRPIGDIVRETGLLIDRGVKEIILVGESTTDWGEDLDPRIHPADLIEALSEAIVTRTIGRDTWLRLLYTHPASLDERVIQAVASSPVLCSYFDVPIQHAATSVLKRMGRQYTNDHLRHLFETIRKHAPDAALRTTLITGFPGETDAEFEELLDFVSEVRFDHLGVFTYSDSDDLISHRFSGHVPEELAMERHDRLMAAQAAISESINREHFGKTFPVLVEENPDDGVYLGRTRFQAPEVDGITFIYASGLEIGGVTEVKITETYEYDLAGETVDESAGPETANSSSS